RDAGSVATVGVGEALVRRRAGGAGRPPPGAVHSGSVAVVVAAGTRHAARRIAGGAGRRVRDGQIRDAGARRLAVRAPGAAGDVLRAVAAYRDLGRPARPRAAGVRAGLRLHAGAAAHALAVDDAGPAGRHAALEHLLADGGILRAAVDAELAQALVRE